MKCWIHSLTSVLFSFSKVNSESGNCSKQKKLIFIFKIKYSYELMLIAILIYFYEESVNHGNLKKMTEDIFLMIQQNIDI